MINSKFIVFRMNMGSVLLWSYYSLVTIAFWTSYAALWLKRIWWMTEYWKMCNKTCQHNNYHEIKGSILQSRNISYISFSREWRGIESYETSRLPSPLPAEIMNFSLNSKYTSYYVYGETHDDSDVIIYMW